MAFFASVANLWNGFWSLFISNVEKQNPDVVYQAAIDERLRQYGDLKKAVTDIVYLRNKTSGELEAREKELAELLPQIPVAVESGDDEVALVLLQRKDELEKRIADGRAELEKIVTQAESAKQSLVSFQGSIEKLKRERDEMLAKKATADAQIKIQETLAGLSPDADIRALDNVREAIHKRQAAADIGAEIKNDSLDAKLENIRKQTGSATARAKLDEMKKQMAAQKAAAEGANVKKTI